jgi:hypothetical protein
MSLTDEQIDACVYQQCPDFDDWHEGPSIDDFRAISRAIESEVATPLLERIAELEKAIKLVQQHHATAWSRGHIAGMEANRMVARDAMKATEQDAWNNTQLTDALMAAESRIEQLEQRNSDLHEDVKRFRAHAMNEKDARMVLEAVRKDAERGSQV